MASMTKWRIVIGREAPFKRSITFPLTIVILPIPDDYLIGEYWEENNEKLKKIFFQMCKRNCRNSHYFGLKT